ncbi:MAG TPA: S24 family peptidase, partial [bacterium]|nr:S24 family peptidase [bacterium]
RETISIPASLVRDPLASFALRVKGESMIEDGILDGDYVVVEKMSNPANGDTVVALIDNQYATLKRFYKEKDRIRLQPANKNMKPIFVTKVVIQGIVRGVLRKYA